MNFFKQLKKNIADFFFLTEKNVLLFASHMSQKVQDLRHQKISLLVVLIPTIIFLILIFMLINTINHMQFELSELINNVNNLNKTVAVLAESQKIQQPVVAKIASNLSEASMQDMRNRQRLDTVVVAGIVFILTWYLCIFIRNIAQNCGVDDTDSNLTMDKSNFFFSDSLDEECEISIFDNDINSDIVNYLMELAQTGTFTL